MRLEGLQEVCLSQEYLGDGYLLFCLWQHDLVPCERPDGYHSFLNCRFLETNTFKAFKKSGKLSSVEFGTIPSLTLILWSIVKGALQGKQPG